MVALAVHPKIPVSRAIPQRFLEAFDCCMHHEHAPVARLRSCDG